MDKIEKLTKIKIELEIKSPTKTAIALRSNQDSFGCDV